MTAMNLRLDRDLTLSIFRRRALVGERKCVPILMYHSISNGEESVAPYYRLTTSPQRFAEQMQWLQDAGYAGVSLEQALEFIDSAPPPSAPFPVAITFDDGFRDFYTAAWPILRRHNFSATMYVPTGFVGMERKSFLGKPCMIWDEIRELRALGICFASHTVNHRTLQKMPFSAIGSELRSSKETMEEVLGEKVTGFAYPYAFPQEDSRFSTRFTEQLRECGYESCVTTVIGRTQPEDDRLRLKRLPISSCDDHDLFMAKLNGSYDWMGSVQRVVRKLKRLAAYVR
jgi:peptidoglycan/xylan/chitin deacetylase (PgdA/CDA1 family)